MKYVPVPRGLHALCGYSAELTGAVIERAKERGLPAADLEQMQVLLSEIMAEEAAKAAARPPLTAEDRASAEKFLETMQVL